MRTDLIVSLGIGAVLVLALNLALHRLVKLPAAQAGAVTALAVLGVYLPLALVFWPGADVLAIHLAVFLVIPLALGAVLGEPAGARSGRRLHWGPLTILVFFCVIAVVDGILITVADRGMPARMVGLLLPEPGRGGVVTSGFPGVVGLGLDPVGGRYSDSLAELAEQAERGWQVRKGWLGAARAGEPAVFQVEVRTREGDPLTAARVEGMFQRLADQRLDQPFAMQEVAPGLYRARVELPAAGLWSVQLELRRGDTVHRLRARTRIGQS